MRERGVEWRLVGQVVEISMCGTREQPPVVVESVGLLRNRIAAAECNADRATGNWRCRVLLVLQSLSTRHPGGACAPVCLCSTYRPRFCGRLSKSFHSACDVSTRADHASCCRTAVVDRVGSRHRTSLQCMNHNIRDSHLDSERWGGSHGREAQRGDRLTSGLCSFVRKIQAARAAQLRSLR